MDSYSATKPSTSSAASLNPNLCQKCNSIFTGTTIIENQEIVREECRNPHHPTLSSLSSAAKAGCFVCTQLFEAVQSRSVDKDGITCTIKDDYDFEQEVWFELDEKAILVFQLHYKQDLDVESSKSISSRATGSNACVAQVQKWFQHCQENHSACMSTLAASGWKPTRLLRIGNKAKAFQLCYGTNLPKDSQYVTLSHRWGLGPVFSLTEQTKADVESGMVTSGLPQTFQDAMSFASRLGIEYIWIDSLCIFQDSKEDWDREAGAMSEVYRNSVLNIAATAAVSGSEGLFNYRNTDRLSPFQVYVDWDGTWCGISNSERACRGWYYLALYDSFADEVRRAPLNQRGWVFQERALSTRIVHFTQHQIYWECMKMRSNETYPDGFPSFSAGTSSIESWSSSKTYHLCQNPDALSDLGEGMQNLQLKNEMKHKMKMSYIKFEPERAYSFWRDCVSDYTRCSLTYGKDKLIAINGVASALGPWLKDDLVAGCWRKSVLRDLLWSRNSDDELILPSHYRAPSWSWAHTDGPVNFITFDSIGEITPHCTVVDLEVLPSTAGGGFIRLRGLLKVTTVEALSSALPGGLFFAHMWDRYEKHSNHFSIMTKEGRIDIKGDEVFLLPILTGPDISTGEETLLGIILIHAKGQMGRFFRVGYFVALDGASQEPLLSSKNSVQAGEVEAVHPNGMHTFCIL